MSAYNSNINNLSGATLGGLTQVHNGYRYWTSNLACLFDRMVDRATTNNNNIINICVDSTISTSEVCCFPKNTSALKALLNDKRPLKKGDREKKLMFTKKV